MGDRGIPSETDGEGSKDGVGSEVGIAVDADDGGGGGGFDKDGKTSRFVPVEGVVATTGEFADEGSRPVPSSRSGS